MKFKGSKILKKFKALLKNIKRNLTQLFVPSGFYFSHKGFCPCCDKEVIFEANNSWLRDSFFCTNCFSIPRERALMITIEKNFPNWRNLHIHESSPIDRGTSIKLRKQCRAYIATQYFPKHENGTIINNFRNEDLERQTFKDEIFDIVITQDVMEHLYNPANAFREIARTLKKGGAHIFTVPIINKFRETEIWATRGVNNEPVFTQTPEFHGNPVDPKGSPVTMHWGFDIVNFIEETSGLKTTIEYLYNLEFGIQAEFIEVLVTRK